MIQLRLKRKAFSMITAIFVILIMSTVGAFILNLSGKMVQETTSQYRKEQAILYAKSYTELAIMTAIHTTCTNKISGSLGGTPAETLQGGGYFAEAYIQYVGNNSTCTNKLTTGDIYYPNSQNRIVIIDTYIHYRDPEHPHAINSDAWAVNSADPKPGITYHRRTIQRL